MKSCWRCGKKEVRIERYRKNGGYRGYSKEREEEKRVVVCTLAAYVPGLLHSVLKKKKNWKNQYTQSSSPHELDRSLQIYNETLHHHFSSLLPSSHIRASVCMSTNMAVTM